MTLTITIELDNAAFEELPGQEAARILRKYATYISEVNTLPDTEKLRDVNGNTVGQAVVTE